MTHHDTLSRTDVHSRPLAGDPPMYEAQPWTADDYRDALDQLGFTVTGASRSWTSQSAPPAYRSR